jgi:SWI/SNF-related matrix-associated actin-dependent regulator 1 of chromatin subfamily A
MTMRLVKDHDIWVAVCRYDEKDIPKQAGFRWDSALKRWWTKDKNKACQLGEFAEEDVRSELAGIKQSRDTMRVASRIASADHALPVPDGLAYMPFQNAGIATLDTLWRSLLADEMGLGKTIQALGLLNLDIARQNSFAGRERDSDENPKVLCIVPANVKLNWEAEARKWLVRPLSIEVVFGSKMEGKSDLTIINYDILAKNAKALTAIKWDYIFIDEAHYLKNRKTKRYEAVADLLLKLHAETRAVLMTGTLIVNRPIELYSILRLVAPERWNDATFFNFARRYCDAKQQEIVIGWDRVNRCTRIKKVWDFSGHSNLEELQNELRSTVMIRRLKGDVLKELPPKTRQIVVIPRDQRADGEDVRALKTFRSLQAEMKQAEKANDKEAYKRAAALLERYKVAFCDGAIVRHAMGLEKVPYVIEYAKDELENVDKILIFGWHQDVLDQIFEGLSEYHPVLVTGRHNAEQKQAAQELFQGDDTHRVFVGNMQAAGIGITLTRAKVVLFAEMDYVPGNISQAEDRAHRIGQHDNVHIKHLVLEDSMDGELVGMCVDKQEVIDRTLNVVGKQELAGLTEQWKELDRQATEKLAEAAASQETSEGKRTLLLREFALDEAKIIDVHRMLQVIAGVCDGAVKKDDQGFNGLDSEFGRKLARQDWLSPRQAFFAIKMCRKYKRQVPTDLYERIYHHEEVKDGQAVQPTGDVQHPGAEGAGDKGSKAAH